MDGGKYVVSRHSNQVTKTAKVSLSVFSFHGTTTTHSESTMIGEGDKTSVEVHDQ